MSVFIKAHTLVAEKNTIGAFEDETELQGQFVKLSLGQLCPVTIIYPTSTGQYIRIDTLRAREFTVCEYADNNEPHPTDCNNLCVNIAKYLDRIAYGANRDCLNDVLPNNFYEFLREGNYEYLSFSCPLSGLVKFAFPINFNKSLVCVVFIGQFNPCHAPNIKYDLYNPDYSTRKNYESFASLYDYISKSIIPEILLFQKNTEKRFKEREKEVLNSILGQAESKLSKAMIDVLNCKADCDSTVVLDLFWTSVSESYNALFKELGAHKVTIFIDDDFSENFVSSIKIYGIDLFSEFKPFQYRIQHSDYFDVNRASIICEELGCDTISSIMLPIRTHLQKCFRTFSAEPVFQYDYVFYKNKTHLPYAIMISHSNSNRDLSEIVVNLIQKIATNIRFELSSVLTKLSENVTKSILRIYRHEIVHQVLALRTSINNLDPENKEYVSPEKINNIFKDCSDCLSALSFMTENIKLFTSPSVASMYSIVQSCPYETIDIFKDVIHKHIAMHRELRDSKNLWFEAIGRTETTQKLECQPRFLNLLLFNIISNAVKYAYRRTNIWFEYLIAEEKHHTKILTIRNFGSEVSAGDEIYRLYYRGPSVEHAETGSGIGLFISKRISEIMGVKLWHQCRRISDYNVPLMEHYLEICNGYNGTYKNKAPSAECIANEIIRLKKNKKYNQIVNNNPQKKELILCEDEIVSRITKATYEVSFILEL